MFKKRITSEELIGKILSGERKFQKFNLKGPFDWSKYELSEKLQKYLKEQIYENNPLIFLDLCLKELNFSKIYLSYLKWKNIDFIKSSFENSSWSNANLKRVVFDRTPLNGITLNQIHIFNAQFLDSHLNRSSIDNAIFERVVLKNETFNNSTIKNTKFKYVDMQDSQFLNSYLDKVIMWIFY